MKRVIMSLLGAIVAFALAATTAYAGKPGGIVAFAGVGNPDYEGSNDHEANPGLISRYTWQSGRYVGFGGTPEPGRAIRLEANLMPESRSKTWKVGPLIQYRLGRDGVEDSQVDKMEDIDDAVELGFFVGEERGAMYLGLTFVADISNEHEGYQVALEGKYKKAITPRFGLIFAADVTYANSDYMETYFGVTSSDAVKSGLSIYTPDGAVKDVGLSMTAIYQPGANWGLIGFLKYNLLLGDAEDSPLVSDEGEKHQATAGLGITYSY